MKNIAPIILFSLLSCFTQAQKVIEKHLGFSPNQSINLDIQIADSIHVIAWNKNEVYVKASININDNKDNDVYLTDFTDAGSRVEVKAKFEDRKNSSKRSDSCNCCNYRSNIYWDIYIPENAALWVKTINGDIIIEGRTKEIEAHSISGFIDLSFAPSRKVDLSMSTISGTIYTDIAMNKPSFRRGGNTVSLEYNGGGEKVELETISGDIFLRKQ